MTKTSLLRRAVSASLATAAITGGLSVISTGTATAAVSHEQCVAATAAAEAGRPIENVEAFRLPRTFINKDHELRIYFKGENPNPAAVTKAVNDWNTALKGRVTLRMVTDPSEADVTMVNDPGPLSWYAGRLDIRTGLIEVYLSRLRGESAPKVVAHELGHALGSIDTGCVSTLMSGQPDSAPAYTPTPLDVAIILQGRY
ncbi:hypothetical protein [Corynebacterium bovis]|uniref:Peptidase M10 metallopeptidase domain-containing protein n=1 Tax=Corynebacterium bovis DSM 20582 = CIP 54.80 TaxID=927655 RepID=A0A8H9YAU2_9CORY|nr:hypothetical protein [Corynebacterium bovis]MBB3115912.1 hypothetical protein [Corynebacterium bovis DSM 20582 = CIP 54.80]QQC46874.1 hypothetical protein I6I09_07090 [Corynebacterium bovis]RRO78923.1 hypothetical protein CXF38_10720 [Corynebacterium bovis]RRO79487.1 hypothetical protein CXF36_09970 [Corynebacterium bovis]RRO79692.1 hypothetical protein CXF37_09705 [Corynebacterium bovis]